MLLWNATDKQRLAQLEQVSFPSLEYIEDIYEKVHVFFCIPYDTGMGRMLKFDLAAFCKQFKLQQSSAYYAVKYLEREGHWTLAEDMDIQTRIGIDVPRQALNQTDFPDPAMPSVLEALMRMYTGIFSYPVPIDEEGVARRCGLAVPALRQVLYQLSINHIVRYVPADHATVLLLQHDRLRPGNVQLNPKRYGMLRSTYHERVQTMLDYVMEDDTCRSQFLLRYFGQAVSAPCGKCDLCRCGAAKPVEISTDLKEWIDAREGQYTLTQLRAAFGPGEDSYLGVLREMIDRGDVPAPED